MTKAIFLSAGVPDPAKPHFVAPSDIVDLTSAVRAFVQVVLGRRLLVWGGHPAISPLIWTTASSLGVDYSKWVILYQSEYFSDQYTEDNKRFGNTRYVPAAKTHLGQSCEQRRNESLLRMRRQMFTDHSFESAVFVGGMRGIVEEFDLIGRLCPEVRRIPILSTGGATALLAERLDQTGLDLVRLEHDINYIPLLYEYCRISPSEPRGSMASEDPADRN